MCRWLLRVVAGVDPYGPEATLRNSAQSIRPFFIYQFLNHFHAKSISYPIFILLPNILLFSMGFINEIYAELLYYAMTK